MSDVELLTVAQVAKLLGISEEAVRRRIERGTLPSLKRGRSRLIPRNAVDYALADPTLGPQTDDAWVSVAVGSDGGSERGTSETSSTELVRLVSDALETVKVEVEKRVNAERDRDAAVERERAEREAREAVELQLHELRAQLAGPGVDAASAQVDDAQGGGPVDQSARRAWWVRMLGGG